MKSSLPSTRSVFYHETCSRWDMQSWHTALPAQWEFCCLTYSLRPSHAQHIRGFKNVVFLGVSIYLLPSFPPLWVPASSLTPAISKPAFAQVFHRHLVKPPGVLFIFKNRKKKKAYLVSLVSVLTAWIAKRLQPLRAFFIYFLFTFLFLSCVTSKVFPAALICNRILSCKTSPVALLVTVTEKIWFLLFLKGEQQTLSGRTWPLQSSSPVGTASIAPTCQWATAAEPAGEQGLMPAVK